MEHHGQRILVACAYSDMQTATIARTLADDLSRDGMTVEVADVDSSAPPPADYDAFVIASPIRFGHFRRSAVRYIAAHRDELREMPGFSVAVSASALDSSRSIDHLADRTGWHPTLGVRFVRPGWLDRWFGDPYTLADQTRVHELAVAIADELPGTDEVDDRSTAPQRARDAQNR